MSSIGFTPLDERESHYFFFPVLLGAFCDCSLAVLILFGGHAQLLLFLYSPPRVTLELSYL